MSSRGVQQGALAGMAGDLPPGDPCARVGEAGDTVAAAWAALAAGGAGGGLAAEGISHTEPGFLEGTAVV